MVFFSAKEQTEIYVVDLDTGMLEFSKQFINGENEGNRYGLVTKLAGACNIDGVEYWVVCVDYSILGLVPVEQAKKELPVKLPMKKIVEEAKGLFTISNAYVVGDYVYYIDNSGENDSMCRIKFDGTDWSQLY